jgi:hypothetical protein
MFMKKMIVSTIIALSFVVLLNGCIAIGTGPKTQQTNATLGQQLIDLQKAKSMGAMTDAEYEAQKARLLGSTSGTPAK